jgi:hypothetical protein
MWAIGNIEARRTAAAEVIIALSRQSAEPTSCPVIGMADTLQIRCIRSKVKEMFPVRIF